MCHCVSCKVAPKLLELLHRCQVRVHHKKTRFYSLKITERTCEIIYFHELLTHQDENIIFNLYLYFFKSPEPCENVWNFLLHKINHWIIAARWKILICVISDRNVFCVTNEMKPHASRGVCGKFLLAWQRCFRGFWKVLKGFLEQTYRNISTS